MKSLGRFLKKDRNSVTLQIIVVILILLILVCIPASVIAWGYVNNGVKQVEQSNTWLLKSYMSQIDREMDLAEQYLYSMVYRNDVTYDLKDKENTEFYYSACELREEVQKDMLNYRYLSVFYVVVPKSDFVYTCIGNAERISMEKDLKGWLLESCRGGEMPAGESGVWTLRELNGERWLNWYYCSDGIWGGAMFAMNDLPMPEQTASGDSVCFVSEEELEQKLADAGKENTVLYAASDEGPFYICEVYDRSSVWSMLPFMQRYAVFIVIAFFLVILICFFVLYHLVLLPLQQLTTAMEELENGNLDYRLPETAPNRETVNVFRTFNQMTGRIKTLRIRVYEEQLLQRKTELNNLSYQLRPHFMVNSLNMVYNLILTKEYESARNLILISARYLRYLLSVTDDFVPLQNEIAHLRNYLEIQKIRYEGQFEYEIRIDPFVEDITVPSMLLQNFAENSVKYAVASKCVIKLILRVDYKEKEGEPYVAIRIKDNGLGYPQWLIEALEKENMELLEQRIGLKNNILRMKMLFNDRASCRFYNEEGAVTEFEFPIQ